MKSIFWPLSLLILLPAMFSCRKNGGPVTIPPATDSFTVVVNGGYGGGIYKAGDTVHIFSHHYSDDQLFNKWSGDTGILNAANEWHTWFIMPDRDVRVTGSVKNSVPFTLQYEEIMGRDRLKPVFYYFPSGHKGFVYLLHGTNGSAANVAGGDEFQLLIRDLVNDNFGVIITEAEEATTEVDVNGDGKIRWAVFPADTVDNVDYANIRIITDTFYKRGFTDRSKWRCSLGMSDGGFYSTALSAIYHYRAGVSYCSQGGPVIISTTQTPIQFCMARNDNNEAVGSTGNAEAFNNFNALNKRGVCSKYFIKERSPVYAERFARRGDITATQSIAIFNELKSKRYIDSRNYFIGYSDTFITAYASNPASFPVIKSLTLAQRLFVLAQINLSVSDHHMYSDFNRATLQFLNNQCR